MKQLSFVLVAAVALLAVAAVGGAFFVVNEAQQVIITQFGEPKRVVDEPGLHFKLPFVQKVNTFDKRWLDWDGDNILTDGSIIDYGSVRQFGLYHHSYRFADIDRMSTSSASEKGLEWSSRSRTPFQCRSTRMSASVPA